METLETALATLRDVEGVLGSFVIDGDGGVTSRDMPAMVDEQALSGAARRMARLRAALETTGRRVEQCSLRFGSYLLLARPAEAHTLCVLVSGTANLMALSMGSTLVARRVNAELAARPVPPKYSPPQVTSQMLPPPAFTGSLAPAPSAALRSTRAAPTPTKSGAPPSVETPLDAPSPTRLFRGRPV
jgi:predicted regulator of Ras-like GTPase activity (Roadblock/LC7/MglB family)